MSITYIEYLATNQIVRGSTPQCCSKKEQGFCPALYLIN